VLAIALLMSLTLNDAPTSQPTSRPVDAARIQRLIAELAAPEYRQRQAAQQALAEVGEPVWPYLIPHICGKNEEIASRAVELIGRPKDPVVRTRAAIALIVSTDPDWMERGVYMLFHDPGEVYDAFLVQSGEFTGRASDVLDPIVEQFNAWKLMDDVFQRNYPRIKKEKPERAEQMRILHLESRMYHAEAAYWSAYEVVAGDEEEAAAPQPGATQPVDHEIPARDKDE
jgi:hypothetical protein